MSSVSSSRNDEYEGYAIDLIHELSLIEGFNYTFLIQVDKKNGEFNPAKEEWVGMIGAIIANVSENIQWMKYTNF